MYVAGVARPPDDAREAYDRTYNGNTDLVLAMFASEGGGRRDLGYSTFLGGPGENAAAALAVEDDSVYVTGSTGGSFPITAGAFDATSNGGADAVLARLRLPDRG